MSLRPDSSSTMSCHRLSNVELREFVRDFRLRKDLTVGPSTAKIYYTSRNYLAGKIPGELVFAVDKWPDFSAVMCAAGEGTYQHMQDVETYTFYWENNEGLLQLLRDVKLVDWSKNFTIAAFSEKGLPTLRQVCQEMGRPVPTQDDMVKVFTAFNPEKPPGTVSLDSSLSIGQLEQQHAELVNNTWSWGGPPKVLEFIQYVLSTFPSTCVYNNSGDPLAFVIVQPWGEYGMARAMVRGGYGVVAAKSMINEILEAGDLPYCFVEACNETVMKRMDNELVTKWDPLGPCYWVYL